MVVRRAIDDRHLVAARTAGRVLLHLVVAEGGRESERVSESEWAGGTRARAYELWAGLISQDRNGYNIDIAKT